MRQQAEQNPSMRGALRERIRHTNLLPTKRRKTLKVLRLQRSRGKQRSVGLIPRRTANHKERPPQRATIFFGKHECKDACRPLRFRRARGPQFTALVVAVDLSKELPAKEIEVAKVMFDCKDSRFQLLCKFAPKVAVATYPLANKRTSATDAASKVHWAKHQNNVPKRVDL